MAKTKQATITDEQIISALLQNGTQRAAAAAVGIDERTIYNRMNDGEFKALYNSAKADILRVAVVNINNQLSAALDVVVEVMTNPENNPATRLQAAQTIINNAGKFAERLRCEEQIVSNQITENSWGLGIR